MKIKDALESYLETESAEKGEKTKAGDERFFRVVEYYFCELLGMKKLKEVQVEDLQKFHIWLKEERVCGDFVKESWIDTTIAHNCQKLKAVFNKAERLERISRNPARWWKVPKGESRERRPLTAEEFEKLASHVPGWFLPVLHTLRLTGARGASLASLEWGHVDFLNSRLTLLSRKGGRSRLKKIVIPISDQLKEILWKLKPAVASGPVFLDQSGSPITAQLISTIGSRAKHKAGFPDDVVLYSLRHGFGTSLVEAGVSPDVIRRLMGHSNLNQQLTYQRFASLKPLEEALELVSGRTLQ